MPPPPSKRRRVELTLAGKLQLISEAERLPKPTLKVLSDKYGVGKSTVGDILKKKDVYKAESERNSSPGKHRFNQSTKLNELLWQWFCQARAKSIPISGPILQEKACSFASDLGVEDFKGSNGWLDRWKKRYNVKAFKISGESADVDQNVVDSYRQRLPDIVSGYSPEDVFNCDETGLYFRALPDKTLSARNQSTKGTKVSKERVTVMLTCSAAGEKLKPLVIGKAAKPRCFKSVKIDQLPVTYVANKKAWMTGILFANWLKEVNSQMKRQKRHILLFLDNATSHGHEEMSNVTLKFLPPNTTSHIQPLDQGIIRAMKERYKRRLLRSLLSKIDECATVTQLCKQITLLDGIYWIADAWNETSASTIVKCFKGGGFAVPGDSVVSNDQLSDDDDDDIPLAELLRAHRITPVLENIDINPPTEECSGEWENDLVSGFRGNDADDDVQAVDSSDDEEEAAMKPGSDLTYREVLDMSIRLKNFAMAKDGTYLQLALDIEKQTETDILKEKCARVQRKISDFFVAN